MSSTDDTRTLTSRGAALRDEDRHEEAVTILREAVAAQEPDADRVLALTLQESGDLGNAKQVLVDAVAKGQMHLAALLGDVADDLGDDELAESSYRRAIAAGDKEALNDFGVFLRSRERYAEAVEVLQRAIAEGDSLAAANLVSLHCDDLGDVETAEQLALRYLSKDEAIGLGAGKAHQNYALFFWEKREDPVGAEREFRLAQDDDEPGWGYELGSFLVEQGRREEARDVLSWAGSWGDVDAQELLDEIGAEEQAWVNRRSTAAESVPPVRRTSLTKPGHHRTTGFGDFRGGAEGERTAEKRR